MLDLYEQTIYNRYYVELNGNIMFVSHSITECRRQARDLIKAFSMKGNVIDTLRIKMYPINFVKRENEVDLQNILF